MLELASEVRQDENNLIESMYEDLKNGKMVTVKKKNQNKENESCSFLLKC